MQGDPDQQERYPTVDNNLCYPPLPPLPPPPQPPFVYPVVKIEPEDSYRSLPHSSYNFSNGHVTGTKDYSPAGSHFSHPVPWNDITRPYLHPVDDKIVSSTHAHMSQQSYGWDPYGCYSQHQGYSFPGHCYPPPTEKPYGSPASQNVSSDFHNRSYPYMRPGSSGITPTVIDEGSFRLPTIQQMEAERSVRRARRNRTSFSKHQLDRLEEIFNDNKYPDVYKREQASAELDLKEEVIRVWFKNRRAKSKRDVRGSGPPTQIGNVSTTLSAETKPKYFSDDRFSSNCSIEKPGTNEAYLHNGIHFTPPVRNPNANHMDMNGYHPPPANVTGSVGSQERSKSPKYFSPNIVDISPAESPSAIDADDVSDDVTHSAGSQSEDNNDDDDNMSVHIESFHGDE